MLQKAGGMRHSDGADFELVNAGNVGQHHAEGAQDPLGCRLLAGEEVAEDLVPILEAMLGVNQAVEGLDPLVQVAELLAEEKFEPLEEGGRLPHVGV